MVNVQFIAECSSLDIENAHSKAASELLGIDTVAQASSNISANTQIMHTILMANIDYKGFRVIAHADMSEHNIEVLHDLNPDALIISDDACEKSSYIGQALNIQSHTVQVNQDRRVRVYTAGSVQVYVDMDTKQHYLITLRDIFPPDHHVLDEESYSEKSKVRRNCRLRPEFLKHYQVAICSDSLTISSGATVTERDTNDSQAIRASRFLRETWIPAFINSLDSLESRPYDSRSLSIEMHRQGINMRHLGIFYLNQD